VRDAYAPKIGFVADLAYKTKRLIEDNATQEGLGRLTKSVTFDVKTLEALRREKGPDERKVFNLVRGLQREIDEDPDAVAVLQPLKDRAERIVKDLEDRKTTGLAAMDLLAALAAERDAATAAEKETGLPRKPFNVYWAVKDEAALKTAGVDALSLAKEAERLIERFPNASVNSDEQRQLRAALYRPLLGVPAGDRTKIVDRIVEILVR
jgi:type I restriction enzyme, R subunit